MSLATTLRALLLRALTAPVRAARRLRAKRLPRGATRILVPFTGGQLEETVLEASIRIARAEQATLVPAYLIVVPLQFTLDAPMTDEVVVAMPLLEAVEHASLRAGVPVDARVETGRTRIHALERLWNVEHFDRIIVPAPVGRSPGFNPKDLLWILTHAPSETLILRPDPGAQQPPRPAWNGHGDPLATTDGDAPRREPVLA
jgi:hypothetical protein